MCQQCMSTAEHVVASAAVLGAIAREPLHRLLADAGLVRQPDLVGRDVRAVAFLRSLDLDPVPVLGTAAVRAADARAYTGSAAGRLRERKRSSAAPIGSHSLAITT